MKGIGGRRRVAILVSMVLLLGVLVAGCGSGQKNITGKWQLANSDVVLDIHKDGTIPSKVGMGLYRFLDSSHLNLYFQAPGIEGLVGYVDYEISFPDANSMILKHPEDGRTWEFTRVQ